jgi:predicted metal-dependent hydrolase
MALRVWFHLVTGPTQLFYRPLGQSRQSRRAIGSRDLYEKRRTVGVLEVTLVDETSEGRRREIFRESSFLNKEKAVDEIHRRDGQREHGAT